MSKRFLNILSFVSWIAWLSYEVLLSRLFSNYFWSIFYVNAIILASFLFFLGVGNLVSSKYVNKLKYFELFTWLYSLIVASVFAFWWYECLLFLSNISKLFSSIILFVLISIPAFLIWFSIPLFSIRKSLSNEWLVTNKWFISVYGIYNFWAAISVLLVEFFLFRSLWLYVTILFISSLNILIYYFLDRYDDHKRIQSIQKKIDSCSEIDLDKNPSRNLRLLFLFGVVSAIFQLCFLKISYNLFWPYNENFSIILSIVLFSIFLSTIFVQIKKIEFYKILWILFVLIMIEFIFIEKIIHLRANILSTIALEKNIYYLYKSFFLFGLSIFPFLLFWLTIPFVLKSVESKSWNYIIDNIFVPNYLMAFSSFWNCVWFLWYIFFLHEMLPIWKILLLVFLWLSTMLIYLWIKKDKYLYVKIFAYVLLLVMFFVSWPTRFFQVWYSSFTNKQLFQNINKKYLDTIEVRKYSDDTFITLLSDWMKVLNFNWKLSLRFWPWTITDIREKIVWASSLLYAKKYDRALVIWLGSGISAGATSQVYNKTTVLEINPAMAEVLPYFKEDNFDIQNNENVEIVIDDWINYLLKWDEKYDLIVNTVPTPNYFSSSKLWTDDVFSIISQRLDDNWIFSTWFDISIGSDWVSILLNTLNKSFKYCEINFLNQSYFNILCSNSELKINEILHTTKEFQQHMESKTNLNIKDFFASLRLQTYPFKSDSKLGINTLDLPYLEFQWLSLNYMWNFPQISDKDFFWDSILIWGEVLKKKCLTFKIMTQWAFPNFCNWLR